MKYAVVKKKTVTHEGDERSHTHPGHGYPAFTETFQEMQEFDSQEQLKDWIRKQPDNTEKYRVIEFQELVYVKQISIDLKRPGVTRSS